MNILVTGGAGYVGCILVPLLLEKGFKVRVIDKLMFGGNGLLSCFKYPGFTFIKGDITNESVLKKALKNIDFIIHLAAYVGYPICKKYPDEAKKTNLDASILLNKLRDSTPLFYASTGSNYGVVENKLCTEDSPLNPITLYGKTKTFSERLFNESDNTICYRFATAFGVSPRFRLDLLINDFCFRAKKLKSLILYESNFKRTFIHVIDMARSIIFSIENFEKMKNEIYNVGSGNLNFTKKDIAEKILKKIDFYLHFAEIGSDEDKRNYEVSYEKIKKVGFNVEIDLEMGLNEILDAIDLIEINNPFSNV